MVALRQRTYEVLDVGRKDDKLSEYADIALITLISLNVLAVIIESVPEIYAAATRLPGFVGNSVLWLTP